MSEHFRRSISARLYERRAAHVPADPAVDDSLTAADATMLLFDRDPETMIAQVRAWLAEEDVA